ncbi:MAG: hypothetical protein JXR48_12775 [Candidatus Delongbacteria bacterium]|nr:hypothetical protein [Candidatus Delongbacteria bacterium]MBN2835826.1 hypothetical protein [Candidatus Delongbacteria bacterium]
MFLKVYSIGSDLFNSSIIDMISDEYTVKISSVFYDDMVDSEDLLGLTIFIFDEGKNGIGMEFLKDLRRNDSKSPAIVIASKEKNLDSILSLQKATYLLNSPLDQNKLKNMLSKLKQEFHQTQVELVLKKISSYL